MGKDVAPPIRKVTLADVDVLADLQAACFVGDETAAWGSEFLTKLLKQISYCAWFIYPAPRISQTTSGQTREKPVGFLLLQLPGDVGDIVSIGILPEWRRKGLGQFLIETAEAEAKSEGYKKMILEVAENNLTARGFYATLGFSQIRVRRGYYENKLGQRLNALVLCREIKDSS